MRLIYSLTSPYARKVRILLIEKGLDAMIEHVIASPLTEPEKVIPANPLGKIPVLLSDAGALYDSPVICEYLDGLAGASLLPVQGTSRWAILRVQALADGIMDAAFSIVMEQQRPEPERSSQWSERWRSAILRATTDANGDFPKMADRFDLGQIAMAAALGYLAFRLPNIDWQTDAPSLATWWNETGRRASVLATRPPM
jgi:glutathione S-transferase